MLNDKWKDLHKKENDLKKSFIEFDEFIIQNEEKRKRATEKISKAKLLLTEKSQQIEELEKKYDQCKELKEILDNDIKNHSYIEKYLLSVVNKNHKKFSTIEDLLKRFDALLEARQILSNVFERYLTQMEETKDAVNKMVMVKCVEIAGLRNTLTDLHNRFETARQSCANWEQYHHKIVLEAMTKVMEIQSVKDSIWQIYEDICIRKGVETVYRGNYAKQLEIIKKALLKFNLVNKMAKALEVPSDNASSTDSIVVSVVKKVSKKLGDKSKSFARQREKNKRQESTSDLRVLQNLFANAPSTQKILIGNLDKRTQQHSIEENGRQSYGHGSSSDSYLGNLENHIHEQQLGHSSTFILDRHSSEYLSRRKSLIDFEEETLDEIPNKLLLNLKEKNSKIQRRFSTSS
ncbi:coiled-coil domain-containing protein 42-like isoform X1 [Diorhabda carinulata]|uniref:coiled-coil domain-containing protein 42-like isoform X1 n=1 Tax=Diorhabda carinulata TaxID=1163345 RepID=UPI0025A09C8A|nr:coiled-coil domain-containing protein 42-like isoform X1 [Diorhabda carinulata]